MKRHSQITVRGVLGVAALLLLSFASARERTWTSSSGESFDGVMLSADESTVRIQRSSDRQQFELPLSRLSAPDREYVRLEAAAKFVRLEAAATKSSSERKSRVVGTRKVRVDNKNSNGGRGKTKTVNVTEKYSISGKTVKIEASTTSMPFRAKIEVLFVSRNGKAMKVFDSKSRSISVSSAGEPFEVKSSLNEHYYGWAVLLKHAGSGKLLAVKGSSMPLEEFARERAGG